MKKYFGLILFVCACNINFAQIQGSEIGFDITASASNAGGTVGLGIKYGLNLNESVIVGPSFRYHRSWFNSLTTSNSGGYNIVGGGAFIHARLYDYFFIGSELEILHSPFNFGGSPSTSKWVPVWLFGGGFSTMIGEKLRLNAGIMYDVLDIPNPQNYNGNPNSPLQPYVKVNKNKIVPILYRISFFFPLTK